MNVTTLELLVDPHPIGYGLAKDFCPPRRRRLCAQVPVVAVAGVVNVRLLFVRAPLDVEDVAGVQ